jgi:hypothetical protein
VIEKLLNLFEKENKISLEQAIITKQVFTFIEKVLLAHISVGEQPSLQFWFIQNYYCADYFVQST